jgi:hypothetical protein
MGDTTNAYKILDVKLDAKEQLGRPRHGLRIS